MCACLLMCDCVCARVYVYTCTRIRNTTSCVLITNISHTYHTSTRTRTLSQNVRGARAIHCSHALTYAWGVSSVGTGDALSKFSDARTAGPRCPEAFVGVCGRPGAGWSCVGLRRTDKECMSMQWKDSGLLLRCLNSLKLLNRSFGEESHGSAVC